MGEIRSFRDLKVWQASMDLIEDIYRVTADFPGTERFGLVSQLRRASISIASNIGEGKRRRTRPALIHHLDIALGSQGEIEVQLEISTRVGLLATEYHRRLQMRAEEVGRMLNGLITSLQAKRGG